MLKPKYVAMFDNNIIQIKKVEIFVKFLRDFSQKKCQIFVKFLCNFCEILKFSACDFEMSYLHVPCELESKQYIIR